MSQNNGPISRLVNQSINSVVKPKKAAPPRMAPTAADYLLGRAQVPQPPAQAPNPIADQQRQNAQAVRRMSPGIDRVANPSNERRVQIRANTPGTPENTRELVRRQVAALPIPDEWRAGVEALVDSALFIRTTYIDPETGMRRRVSPLASQNAIRQTGLLDPNDAMEVVELLKTEGGVRLLQTEVKQFQDQRTRGSRQAKELEALARPGNVDPNIAGIGAVIDAATMSPIGRAVSDVIQNDPANIAGALGAGEALVEVSQKVGPLQPLLQPLRMLGVDPDAIQRGIRQFGQSAVRGFAGGVSSMTRIPQLLGSKEWADLSDAIDKGIAMRDADKPLDDTFFNEIGRTAGGVVAQIAPALLTGGSSIGASVAGRMVASAVFATTEAMSNAVSGFDRAVKEGQNIEEARQRAARALPVDMIVSTALNRFGEFSDLSPLWKKMFASSFSEGVQEWVQTGLEGYVATGELDLSSPEAIKGMALGAALGPWFSAGIDLATGTQMEGGAEAVPPQVGSPIQRVSASTIEDAYADAPDYGEDLPEGSLVGAARWRDTETLRTAIIEDGIAPPPAQSGGSSAVNAGYAAQYKRYVDLFNRVSRSTYNVNNATISRDTFNKEVELLRDLHIEFWREASRPQPAQRVSANTIERSYQGIDEGPELSAGALVNLAQQFAPQSQPQPVVTPSPAQQPSGTRGESAVVETNLQDSQARAKAISESPIPGATEAAWSSGDQRIVVGVERIQDAISRVGTSPSPKEKDVVRLLTTMHKVRARAEAAGVDIDPAGELQGIEARMRDLGYELDPGLMAVGDTYDSTMSRAEVVGHIQDEGELRVHEQFAPAVFKDGKLIAEPQIITTGYSENWQSPEDDGGNAAQLPPPPDSTLPPTATAPAGMPQPAQPQQEAQAPTQAVAQAETPKEPWQMGKAEYVESIYRGYGLEPDSSSDPQYQQFEGEWEDAVRKAYAAGKPVPAENMSAVTIGVGSPVVVRGMRGEVRGASGDAYFVDYGQIGQYEPKSEVRLATPDEITAARGSFVEQPTAPLTPAVARTAEEGPGASIRTRGVDPFNTLPLHQITRAELQQNEGDTGGAKVPKSKAVLTLEAKWREAQRKVDDFVQSQILSGNRNYANNALYLKLEDASESAGRAYRLKREAEIDAAHYRAVEQALKDGLPVPPEVLADYPDLAAKYQPQPVAQTPANAPSPRKAAEGAARPRAERTEPLRAWLESASQDDIRKLFSKNDSDVASLGLQADVRARMMALAEAQGLAGEAAQNVRAYTVSQMIANTGKPGKRLAFIVKDDTGGEWWSNTHIALLGANLKTTTEGIVQISPVINRAMQEATPISEVATIVDYTSGLYVTVFSDGTQVDAKYWEVIRKMNPDQVVSRGGGKPVVAIKGGKPVALITPLAMSEARANTAARVAQPQQAPAKSQPVAQPVKAAQSQDSARPQPATTPKPELAPDTAQGATKKANADLRRKVQSSQEPSQQDVNALQREYASKGYSITRNDKGQYIITKTEGGFNSSTPGQARFGLLRMYSFDAVRDVDAVIAQFESYETAAKADEALVEYAKDKQPHELTYAEIEQFRKASRLGEALEKAMLERYFYSLPAEQRRAIRNSDEWPSQYSHRMAVEEAYGSGMDVPANVLEELGMTGAPRSAYKRTKTPSPVVAPKPAPKVAEPTPQPKPVAVQPGVFPLSNARPVQKRDHIVALYPNRVGGKFSPADIEAVKEWAQSEQATVVASPTVITVTGPLGKNWAATAMKAVESVRGLTVRQARNKAAVDQYNQRVEAKNAADKAYIAANPDVAKWLASVFGDNFANPHNQAALIRYLVGDAKKFDGGMNPSWVPGLEKLGLNSSNASNLKTNDIAAVIKQAWQAQSQKAPAKAPESVSPGVQQAEGSTAGVAETTAQKHLRPRTQAQQRADAKKPTPQSPAEPKVVGEMTMGRSRPVDQIDLDVPIVGPSGAKLTSYRWQWKESVEWNEGKQDFTEKRVSNWDAAVANLETGRDIVHHFVVEMPDGGTRVVSLETAAKVLGFNEPNASLKSAASSLKTKAKNLMRRQLLQAQLDAWDAAYARAEAVKLPEPQFRDGLSPVAQRRGLQEISVDGGDTWYIFNQRHYSRLDEINLAVRQWREDQAERESGVSGFKASSIRAEIKEIDKRIARAASRQSPDILASPSKPAKSKDTITVDGKERPRTNSNGQPIHPTEEGIRAFWEWFGESKIVDEQGRPLVVYHGTRADFDAFSMSYFGATDSGYYGKGFYFSPHEVDAKDYGPRVVNAYVGMKNPLRLPHSGEMGHISLLDARDILAELYDRQDLKTVRTLPDGYEVKARELDEWDRRGSGTTYAVWPKRELWDKGDVLYGDDASSELQAIVAFNDARNGVDVDAGWLSGMLKEFGRESLSETAKKKGYDGILVVDASFRPGEIAEIVVFNPTQIKSAIGNQGTFSPDNPSILASPQPVVVNKGNVQAKTQGPTGATPIAWKIVPIPHNGPTIYLDQLTELGVKAFGQGIVGTSATGTKGAFVLTSGTLYVKKSNDHITYAHEGAHRLDQQYKITDALIGSPAHAELDSGHFDHTVPANANASVKMKEQFAAFMEAYVSDPSTLNTVAPNMVKAFEASVPKETVEAIRKFSEGLRRYAGQDPEAKVKGSFLAPTTPKTFVQMAADNVQGLVTDENLDAAAREVFDEYAPFVRTVDRMVGRGNMDAGRAKRKGERGITDNPNDLEVALREVPYTEQMLEDAIRKGMLNRLVAVKTGKTTRTTKSLLAILEPFGVRGKNQDVFMENWRDFEAYIASMRHLDFARRQTKIAAENVKNYKNVLAERLKQKKAAAKMRADSDLQAELLRIARDPSLTNAQRKAKERVLVDAHKARVARAYMRLEAGAKGALTTYTKHQNAEAKRRGEQSGIAVPYGVPGVDSTIQVANETIKRLQQDKKKWARLKQAEKDLREFSFTMIDNLEWAGILAPEQAQSIKDNNPYWFAIQRVEDPVTEPTITDLLHYGQSGLQAKNPVHALVGSSKSKQDVISALVGRVALTIDSAARNRVAQVTANWLNANGLPDGTDGEIIRVRKSDGIDATTPNTFKFYDHGQEVVWQVHPKNAALIDSLNRVGSLQSDKLDRALVDAVASATSMLHTFIVTAPPFILRNLWRDTFHRISMVGGNPLDTFLPKDKRGKEFKDAFGMGLGRSTVLTNRETYERNQRKVMKELTQQGNVIYQIGRGYHALQAKAEEANRLVVYKDAYKKFRAMGRTEYEADLLAFYAAREGMVDFKKAGVTARKVSRFIPFFSAAIAGQRTTGTQLRNNPGKVAVRMMEIAVVGIALEQAFAAMGGDDEEKRLAGLSPYQREMFWNFRIGGDEGFWLSIPKGHEQAVGISMVERMHEVARGREVKAGRTMTTLRDNTLPISRFEDTLGGWKALFEIGFNRSLHNMKTIVPDHERGLAMDARKGTQYASPVGQGMAGVFQFGDPRQWDHAIENMTGYYGRIVTELSEAKTPDEYIRALSRLTGLTMPGSPSQNEDVIAVDNLLSSIGVRPPGWDALKDSFYDAPDEASRQRAARRLISTAEQWRTRLEPIMERNLNVRKDVAKQYLEAVGGYN